MLFLHVVAIQYFPFITASSHKIFQWRALTLSRNYANKPHKGIITFDTGTRLDERRL